MANWTPDGQPLWMAGTHQEISECKCVEQELIEAKVGAEAAGVAKRRFLVTMSPEIRMPVNGILAMAQLLLAGSVDEQRLMEDRAIIGAMLELLGVEHETAQNGEQAVARVIAEPFDAALRDVHLPKVDGYAATEQIRAGESSPCRQPGVPIVALTAGAFPRDRQRCFEAGRDDYLARLVDTAKLRAVLGTHLPGGTRSSAGGTDPVTAGGSGVVAVSEDGSSAALWTSTEGWVWSRVVHDQEVFGGSGRQWMAGVSVGGPGLVAIGTGGNDAAGVWTSP